MTIDQKAILALTGENERLRAEVQEADKAYEYELGERRAAEARIEAAEGGSLYNALARSLISRIMETPTEWVDTPGDVRLRLEATIRRAEDNERLRANMGLGETIPHCSDCGVLLHCEGSQREHEWEWHRRYKEAEARIEAALETLIAPLQYYYTTHAELRAVLRRAVKALKGEGER